MGVMYLFILQSRHVATCRDFSRQMVVSSGGFLPPKLRKTGPAHAELIFSAAGSGARNLLQSQPGPSSRDREIGRAWNPEPHLPRTI